MRNSPRDLTESEQNRADLRAWLRHDLVLCNTWKKHERQWSQAMMEEALLHLLNSKKRLTEQLEELFKRMPPRRDYDHKHE